MELKVVTVNDEVQLPSYATEHSSGLDLRAFEEVTIEPGKRKLINTGMKVQIPLKCEGQIRPRSGMAWNHGITVLNSPGTIDADYRGEVKIMVINLGDEAYTIQKGERIAQMVITPYVSVDVKKVESLEETERGEGGFGSTGK